MGGRPRGRPRGDRPRPSARPKQPGEAASKDPAGKLKASGDRAKAAGAAGTARRDGAVAARGGRAVRALNPRKTPTNSRIRTAALAFGALAVVLGILGLTVNRAYLQPAVLTLLLAVLWGVRAITMR
jgi:hypothetical protein